MATYSNTLVWKIPWVEEPRRLQSVGSQRVGHDFTFTFHTSKRFGNIIYMPVFTEALFTMFKRWKQPKSPLIDKQVDKIQMNRQTCVHAKSLYSYVTLFDPMNSSSPGSSVHGILLARILEWVAIPFSRGASQPRDQTGISYVSCIGRWVLYHKHHLGSPIWHN